MACLNVSMQSIGMLRAICSLFNFTVWRVIHLATFRRSVFRKSYNQQAFLKFQRLSRYGAWRAVRHRWDIAHRYWLRPQLERKRKASAAEDPRRWVDSRF